MPDRLRIFSLLVSVFILSGCVTVYNPATQRNETLFINTPSEVSLGQQLDAKMGEKYKISGDTVMLSRVEAIGRRVAAASDRQDLTYYFRVVDDKELNAFSIPGGYVYVNTGLMQIANDDELACVIAHEIGHIAARHSVKKLQATLGYQVLIGIALGLSGQQGLSSAANALFDVTSLGYSRKDEFLADSLAVKYALKSGFNPRGMITFFEKLKNAEKQAGPNFRMEFLSSHPDIDKRIQNIESQILLRHQ